MIRPIPIQGAGDPQVFADALRTALMELARSPLASSLDPTGDGEAFSLRLLDEGWRALTSAGIDGATVVRAMLECAGAIYEFCDDHSSDTYNWERFL